MLLIDKYRYLLFYYCHIRNIYIDSTYLSFDACAPANQLHHGPDIIERLVEENNLMTVGAEYLLETGEVNFFNGPLFQYSTHIKKPELI